MAPMYLVSLLSSLRHHQTLKTLRLGQLPPPLAMDPALRHPVPREITSILFTAEESRTSRYVLIYFILLVIIITVVVSGLIYE